MGKKLLQLVLTGSTSKDGKMAQPPWEAHKMDPGMSKMDTKDQPPTRSMNNNLHKDNNEKPINSGNNRRQHHSKLSTHQISLNWMTGTNKSIGIYRHLIASRKMCRFIEH